MARQFVAVLAVMVCVCVTGGALAAKGCGSNPMADMDQLIADIVPFGSPKVRAPVEADEIPAFCSYYGKALKDLESYNDRCIKSDYKDKITRVAASIRKSAADVCGPDASESKKASFLKLGSCIRSGAPKLRQCITKSKERVLGIHNAPQDDKLALLCCELGAFKKCIFNGITSQSACSSESSADKIKAYVANFGSSGLASACAEYKKNPSKCKGLSYPGVKSSQHVPKTFTLSVVSVIKAIDN